MGSSLSKPEAGFRKSLAKRFDKVFKPKPSGQTTPVPTPNARSPSLHPEPNEIGGTTLAPALAHGNVTATPGLVTPAPTTPARVPSPVPIISPPAEPATDSTLALVPKSTQATTTGVWAVLEASLRALHKNTEVFPPVQSAVGSILGCLDFMQQMAKDNDEREELASELSNLSDLMVQHMQQSNSPRMSDAVLNATRGIEEQVKIIKERRDRGAGWRLLEARDEEELLSKCCRRIGALFRQLQTDASMSMWKVVNDQASNALLDRLGPVHLATYDSTLSTSISRRTCTANTRTAILSGLNDWSYDPTLADIYWMNGMAGTGKTTIACTFAESLEQTKRLAASFFCTRTQPECRSATRILPTIGYQLGRYSVPFQSALCQSLQENPDVGNKNLTKQFDRLLKEPLLKVKDAMPGHLVVVIDALDECDNMTEVELLLSILLKGAAGLPVQFFVTSRPEPEIYDRMMIRDHAFRDVLHLHDVEQSLVQADIELYLQTELEPMSPSPDDIQELVRRSGRLFIYAATLVRYIQPHKLHSHSSRRLESVLAMSWVSTTQYAAIDALYTAVLAAALDEEELDTAELEDVRRVLHTVVCAQEPLSIASLTALSGIKQEAHTNAALQRLRAVLHVSETSGLVSTLHASFPDFMFDKGRSQSYHCDLPVSGQELAGRCFEVMKTELRFNICNLESSFVPDSHVEGLGERLAESVSVTLWYACQYWVDHLTTADYSDLLDSKLEDFLLNWLLFWMEVLNLKQKIGAGLQALAKVKSWVSIGATSGDTSKYAEDARRFVAGFATSPVSRSTPHIYISSLPFCAKSSFVFPEYYKRMKGLLSVTGSALEGPATAMIASWAVESEVNAVAISPNGRHLAYGCQNGALAIRTSDDGILAIGSLEGHTGSIKSVAYSPDGSRIISGSDDNTIRIWNAHNGAMVTGPLRGHTEAILSIACSPDGTRIASGSRDRTIRIWSAQDGTLVAGPIEGHTSKIWAIAYSPDNTRLVSGSEDKTVQVWNGMDGTPATGPLEGHTSAVWSVAYSLNGAHIISSSGDQTIRIWDVQDDIIVAGLVINHTTGILWVTCSPDSSRIVGGCGDNGIYVWSAQDGALVAGPFQGHTSAVQMVAYSPDGGRIVSCSNDSTIRVWNTQGDTFVAKKPDNHSDSINSVAYSPDDTRIVSGSSDNTVRIWHARNGSLVVGPLQGHTKAVTSVAYSPASTRIVSGSDDHTIRVWNAHDGALVLGPLEGHTDSVRSVAYSPDATRIVSGSNDRTIRVWDAEDGTLVAGPLEGHTDWVRSVVYSPHGTRIASGSDDRTIRVWNAHDGTLDVGPLVGHSDYVTSVAYSPDGTRIASGSDDTTIRVWNAKDGALVAGPFKGHTDYIYSVAYSPAGTRIVSGSRDKTIRVWNAEDGTLVAGPLNGHTDWVNSVAYSPDGACIVSGSYDQTIRVWSARDGASIPSLQAEGQTNPETINSLADGASTDSSGWVTASDSRLLLWVPPEVQPRDMLSQLRCHMVIGLADPLFVEYGDLVLGRRWGECYQS